MDIERDTDVDQCIPEQLAGGLTIGLDKILDEVLRISLAIVVVPHNSWFVGQVHGHCKMV